MKDVKGKVAVVTGAGSGIGRALAQELAAKGAQVWGTDVNAQGLGETVDLVRAGGYEIVTSLSDVSQKDDVAALAEKVRGEMGQVDILINNAGVAMTGTFSTLSLEDMEWIFSINYWGVVYCTQAFLPLLMARPESSLVNVSSLFGLLGVARNSAYCSTKFAVRALSETLRQELKGSSVSVTSVHPGGIKTNIVRNARVIDAEGQVCEEKHDKFSALFDRIARTTPEKAASLIVSAIEKKKPRLLIGSDAKTGDLIQRFFPGSFDRILSRLL